MNKKTARTLSAIACEMYNESPELIQRVHNIINDKRDGYDFDFIMAVNSYRSLFGLRKMSVNYPKEISNGKTM